MLSTCVLGVAVAALVAGCATGGAGQASMAPKRILLIAGRPSHPPGMHEFRAGTLLLQKSLAGHPGVTVEVYSNGWPTKVEGSNRVDDNSVFEGAAAVVIYADGGGGHPAIKPDRLSEIRHERRPNSRYASLENCRFEISEAEAMMRRSGIRWLSTTTKSIEEIATTILQEILPERLNY